MYTVILLVLTIDWTQSWPLHLKLTNELELCGAEYQIVKPLAKGGFGFIYVAKEMISGKTVVIKQVLLDTERHQIMKQQEAAILQLTTDLPHENVISLLCESNEKEYSLFVLEYCENGDLLTYLHDYGNMPEEEL